MQNVPLLRFGLALFFNAWFDLDTERDRPELVPISRSACFNYARDYDFDECQREDLWFYIQRMDNAALKWQSEENKRRKPPPPPEGS